MSKSSQFVSHRKPNLLIPAAAGVSLGLLCLLLLVGLASVIGPKVKPETPFLGRSPGVAQVVDENQEPLALLPPGINLDNGVASTEPPVPTSTSTRTSTPTSTRTATGTPTPSPLPLTPTATIDPSTPTPEPPTETATPEPPTPTFTPRRAIDQVRAGATYGERRPDVRNRPVRIFSNAPQVKLDAPIYETYIVDGVWEVADYAAGHQFDSANPGESGNIVIAGHNNWRGEVFRDLEFLKPGDIISIETQNDGVFNYAVESIDKLQEAGASYEERMEHAKVMNPTPDDRLTLITCWPYSTYTHRLVVVARPVP